MCSRRRSSYSSGESPFCHDNADGHEYAYADINTDSDTDCHTHIDADPYVNSNIHDNTRTACLLNSDCDVHINPVIDYHIGQADNDLDDDTDT